MHKETQFRKVFCRGCDYLGPRATCDMPATKDCVLQYWRTYARRAMLYAVAWGGAGQAQHAEGGAE